MLAVKAQGSYWISLNVFLNLYNDSDGIALLLESTVLVRMGNVTYVLPRRVKIGASFQENIVTISRGFLKRFTPFMSCLEITPQKINCEKRDR